MFFTLILAISTAFTFHVITVETYYDDQDNKYYGFEPVNEKLKSLPIIKTENKKPERLTVSYPTISTSYSSTPTIVLPDVVKPAKPKTKRRPIKVIQDDWFMQHYDRICELEAISHKSVLDMYDHDPLFAKFSDLKGLAKNMAWEMQQQKTR